VILLTGLTGAVIGGLAWREQRTRSRALLDAAMAHPARLTAAHAARVFEDAEATTRVGLHLVQPARAEHGHRAASGPVVAGNIGSPHRVKYGVVGPAVKLTARIQALTGGGEVLLEITAVSEAAG
jgi:class 3 adenylate cyclase